MPEQIGFFLKTISREHNNIGKRIENGKSMHLKNYLPDLAIIFISFLLALFAYRQILNVSLTPEDFEYISKARILETGDLFKIFLPPVLGGTEVIFRRLTPFVVLSFWADSKISLNAFHYHLTLFLFHLGNIFLLYLLAKKLFKKSNRIFHSIVVSACVFFFAVFPYHSETVSWNAARLDMMAAFFYLLSLYFYILYMESKKHLFPSVIFFLIAIFSKENALTFPIVAVLFALFLFRKIYWKSLLPFVIVILLWLFSTILKNFHAGGCFLNCNQFLISRVFLLYLMSSVVLLVFLKVLRLRKTGRLLFFWLIFGLLFSPTIFLPTSERYLYLPSVTLSLFFGEALIIFYNRISKFFSTTTLRTILVSIVSLTIFLEISLLYIRNHRWVVAGAIIDNVLNQTAIYTQNSDDNSVLYFLNLPNGYRKAYVFQGRALDEMLKLKGIRFKTMHVISYNLEVGQSHIKIIDDRTVLVSSETPFIILPSETLSHNQDGNPLIETELFQEIFSNNSHDLQIKFKDQSLKSNNSYIFYFDGTSIRII